MEDTELGGHIYHPREWSVDAPVTGRWNRESSTFGGPSPFPNIYGRGGWSQFPEPRNMGGTRNGGVKSHDGQDLGLVKIVPLDIYGKVKEAGCAVLLPLNMIVEADTQYSLHVVKSLHSHNLG